MTDILCNWLNLELKLSRRVEANNFAREFSSGYLVGEVLQKYGLQDDFDQFSQSKTANAKLGNFTRLEPVLHLLEVPFDTNVARDMMTEKFGVSTRLMYQVFIALHRKTKANLTGVAMETMRPAAPVKLEAVESGMYKERLKMLTPRQTDLNLDALKSRFHQKQIEMEKTAFKERFEEEERHLQDVQEHRQSLILKYKESQAKKSEMLAKIQAATVHIPKPPPNRTARALALQREMKQQREADAMFLDIESFEEKMKRTIPPSKAVGDMNSPDGGPPDPLDLVKPASNNDYIDKIRKRLNEDGAARAEREKRRRKVLVDQLKAHEAQEEAHREEMLVNRLMRQSQQERRIAVQLLQARHEKDVIRHNRILREKQYEQRRLKEFEDALNREAEMARLAQLEYKEQTKKDQELHNEIAKARAEAKYSKHYNMCLEILYGVVDFATKVGEYRELTNKKLPAKLMRDWTELFVSGKPLYETAPDMEVENETLNAERVLEEERQTLLDEADFTEYRNMVGEWQPAEDSKVTGPPKNNPIVGHIVKRLFNIVHPPTPPPPPPEFPPFPIKACVLGKVFAGKSSCVRELAEYHRLTVLSADHLVTEAVEAHKNGETTDAAEDMSEEEIDLPPKTAGSERSAEDGSRDRSTSRASRDRSSKASNAKSGRLSKASHTSKNSKLSVSQATSKGRRSSVASNKKMKATGDRTPAPTSADPDNRTLEEASKDDGMEKGDAEKPVPDESSQNVAGDKMVTPSNHLSAPASRASSRPRSRPGPKASSRAKLGLKASKFLKRGKPVDDQLTVDIIIEAVKRMPPEMGWILDGFPATYQQAKLLEKALTGMDAGDKKTAKSRKAQLAPEPRPTPPPPEPGSGINVVIMFDIDNELCLRRSAGRTASLMTDQQFHQEFNPPPDGSATGVGKQEMVIPVEDPAHDQEQIQHRLTTFQDQWPKLEKWFTKFGTLRIVDATQEQKTVYLEVEKILEDTLRKLRGEDQVESSPVETTEPKEEEKPVEPEKPQEPPTEAPKEDESRSRPSSKKGSRAGSAKRSGSRGSAKGSKSPARSPSKPDSAKKSGKGSRASSAKRGKSGKKGKTPEPEPETPPEPPSTPLPVPGSDEWEFVDRIISDEMAKILAPQWDTIENHYIDGSKVVFRNIREERENIIRYFYSIRNDFKSFLRRPDTKQEFVSSWQKEYNDLSDDLRDDEESRAELHQRVDDLRERLWSICDDRKITAENERETMMKQGWLEDHLGLLANHYITLQQGEIDRFQDTIRMMKDYYKAMEGKIPEEISASPVRIPLIELPVEVPPPPAEARPESGAALSVVSGEGGTRPTTPADDAKSSASKSGTPSGKKKKGADPPHDEPTADGADDVEKKHKIPLVPRRPLSPDTAAAQAAAKGGKPDKGKGGKGAEVPDAPPPPEDPDDRLIYDAYLTALTAIDRIIAAEQAAREAEEEAERARDLEREKEKEKAAAATKGKGGKPAGKGGKKSRSPSPKKGKASPAPTTPPPQAEETEEEKLAKKLNERARIEFFAALEEEAQAAKIRLDQIRLVAYGILANLRLKAEEAYADMNDWLGARFLKEMESIDHMSEVMRNAIETSSHIKEQLVIDQEDFLVNEEVVMPEFEKDLKVLRTPSPVERPQPIESAYHDTFTVDQIMNLYQQFALTAPTGVLSIKAFQEIFSDLSALTHGTEQIPDIWMNVSQEKLDTMALHLSPDGEYIDWRMLILAAAQPWPRPTQSELLETLSKFTEMDEMMTGFVTREQFERVNLWFKGPKPLTPANPNEPYPFDRVTHLKTTFFDVFADHNSEPPQLDYVQMLLYFSASNDSYEGFLRALTVASGTHMPRLPRKLNKSSRPTSQASLAASIEFEGVDVPGEEGLMDDIPEDAINARVPLDALDKVLHHGQSMRGDTHRFSVTADPEDAFSRERLMGVYQDLGSDGTEPVLFSNLMEHPVAQDIVSTLQTYKAEDLQSILLNPVSDPTDSHSIKTGE